MKSIRVVRWQAAFVASCILAGLLSGCAGKRDSPASKDEERLLEKMFTAIKKDDWETFSRYSKTLSDFALARDGITGLKARQSYQGGVLKPEQVKKQKAQFDQAVAGGDGIDFKKAKYVSAGEIVKTGSQKMLTGGEIPFKVFSLKIKIDGEVQDTSDLGPLFVVVDWKGAPRLMGLASPE